MKIVLLAFTWQIGSTCGKISVLANYTKLSSVKKPQLLAVLQIIVIYIILVTWSVWLLQYSIKGVASSVAVNSTEGLNFCSWWEVKKNFSSVKIYIVSSCISSVFSILTVWGLLKFSILEIKKAISVIVCKVLICFKPRCWSRAFAHLRLINCFCHFCLQFSIISCRLLYFLKKI